MTDKIRRPKKIKTLPHVTPEIINQVALEAAQDNKPIFQAMAAAQPELYTLLYEAYYQSEQPKKVLFGLVVGMYAMLERALK